MKNMSIIDYKDIVTIFIKHGNDTDYKLAIMKKLRDCNYIKKLEDLIEVMDILNLDYTIKRYGTDI